MPPKKRKLSPSASSHSSATPSRHLPPSTPDFAHLTALPNDVGDSLDARLSESSTPAPVFAKDERTVAKPGNIILGSGDGTACGDECFLWTDLPMNKQGYRYAPCVPSPIVSPSPLYPFYRTLPAPPPTPPVHVSWLDRSNFLRLSPDGLTATTDRGYRSGRVSVSVREGTWYYECIILRGLGAAGAGAGSGGDTGNAHVRIGWGRREANLDAPVGADAYGYGIRDVSGDKVHISRPKPHGTRGFATGDVVGCLITLPLRADLPDEDGAGPSQPRKRLPLRYKGQLYFEMDDYAPQKEMDALVDREGKLAAAKLAAAAATANGESAPGTNGSTLTKGKKTKNTKKGKNVITEDVPQGPVARDLKILKGSRIDFFINGEPVNPDEPAFTDIYDFMPLPPLLTSSKKHTGSLAHENAQDDGTLGYYPMVSCFGRGKARLNFGPTWEAPPPPGLLPKGARPLCERWDEWRKEEEQLDEREEQALAAKLEKEIEANKVKRAALDAKLAKRKVEGSKLKDGSPRTGGAVPVKKGKSSKASSPALSEAAAVKEEEDDAMGETEGPIVMGTPASPSPGSRDGTPAGGKRSKKANGSRTTSKLATPIPLDQYEEADGDGHGNESEGMEVDHKPIIRASSPLAGVGDEDGPGVGDEDAEGEEDAGLDRDRILVGEGGNREADAKPSEERDQGIQWG